MVSLIFMIHLLLNIICLEAIDCDSISWCSEFFLGFLDCAAVGNSDVCLYVCSAGRLYGLDSGGA